MRALLIVMVLAGTAGAETAKQEFARGLRIDESAVLDVEDLRIEAGPYHRAIVGRFKKDDLVLGGAVLTWCDAKQKCWLATEWLRKADQLEVLGIVDLAGGAAAFPTHRIGRYDRKALAQPKAKFPALIVRITERETMTAQSRYGKSETGEHRRVEIAVLSLALADTRDPQILREAVDESWPTGGGHYTSFAIDKDGALVATEQRRLENGSMCMRPKPTTRRYTFDKETRRFREGGLPGRTGC